MSRTVNIDNMVIGKGFPLVLISGPCVIEDYETTYKTALFLKNITQELDIPFIFKAHYSTVILIIYFSSKI